MLDCAANCNRIPYSGNLGKDLKFLTELEKLVHCVPKIQHVTNSYAVAVSVMFAGTIIVRLK